MCWLLATGLIQVPLIIVIYEAGGIRNHQAYYSCFHFSIVNLKHTVMFRKSWRDWQFLKLSQTSDKCCQACRSHWLVFLFSISTFVGVCRTMLGPVSKPLRMVWCLRKSSGLRFQKPRSRACHLSFVWPWPLYERGWRLEQSLVFPVGWRHGPLSRYIKCLPFPLSHDTGNFSFSKVWKILHLSWGRRFGHNC